MLRGIDAREAIPGGADIRGAVLGGTVPVRAAQLGLVTTGVAVGAEAWFTLFVFSCVPRVAWGRHEDLF